MKTVAVFIGYQDMGAGRPPQPLFNVIGDHRLNRSTVSLETLHTEKIDVPPFPFPEAKIKNNIGEPHK